LQSGRERESVCGMEEREWERERKRGDLTVRKLVNV